MVVVLVKIIVILVVLVKGVECECRSRIYIPFPISTFAKEKKTTLVVCRSLLPHQQLSVASCV